MSSGVINQLTYGELEAIRTAADDPATGLVWTATATLVNDGTTTAALTLTEIGSTGRYRPSFTPSAVGVWALEYSATIDGVTAYFGQSVQVKTAAQFDPAASITASGVTVSSPVATDQTITLVRGDDYLNADGRAPSWSVSSPDLTGATVAFRIFTYAGATVLSKTMTNGVTTVRVDLTSSETAALSLGSPAYRYEIVATLADTSTATLVSGTVWVQD